MNIDKIVYINLDRRKDRREKIEKVLSGLNVPFERFAAISPEWEDISEGGKYFHLFQKCTDKLKRERKGLRGRIGCWLSHKTIIEQNIGNSRPVLIIEDDISFTQKDLDKFLSRLSFLPNDWDVFRVCWKYIWRGREDFIRYNFAKGNLEKIADYIFNVTSNRKILGGSHFVLCQNFEKISNILDEQPLIEADIAYSSKGMNSYLTRLESIRQLSMGTDII